MAGGDATSHMCCGAMICFLGGPRHIASPLFASTPTSRVGHPPPRLAPCTAMRRGRDSGQAGDAAGEAGALYSVAHAASVLAVRGGARADRVGDLEAEVCRARGVPGRNCAEPHMEG